MIDPMQVFLFTVITILTVMLVLNGWQLLQVLIETRMMLKKFNTMADNALLASGQIEKSLENLSGVSEGVKAVFSLIKLFGAPRKSHERHV
jgi:hypothetical protein